MIGYHYTTWSHWQNIQHEGLVPYPLNKEEISNITHSNPKAIWLWPRKLKGKEHIGSVIYQATMKSEMRVVLLKVKYPFSSPILKLGKHNIKVLHDGQIGNFSYHNQVPSILLTNPISPRNIELERVYDFGELLDNI